MRISFPQNTNHNIKQQILDYLKQIEAHILATTKLDSYVHLSLATTISSQSKQDLQQLHSDLEIHDIDTPYKLVSRAFIPADSIINITEGITIGGQNLSIIAGPCAVESKEQLAQTVEYIHASHVPLLRAGIFKPRTSPYSFQGLGEAGLVLLEEMKQQYNLPIVCELMSVAQIQKFAHRIDVIQIGARNMQNYDLLKAAGQIQKPVILKRGFAATIEEFLLAAEYIAAHGNINIILCERGIRSFDSPYRNITDINAIPYLKKHTHLPIILDPSHATGIDWMVEPIAKAAIAAGAHGIMLETHIHPESALSDGPQSLNKAQFQTCIEALHRLHKVL